MGQLSLTGAALDQLLACWAPIGTAGPGSLYQAMFLTPTLLQQDPGAQTATVAATVNVGDMLHTAINMPPASPARCPTPCMPGDTAATAAAAIAAAINAATAPDPVTGLPLNSPVPRDQRGRRDHHQGGLHAGLLGRGRRLSETYTAAATSPLLQTATVAGSATAGDTLTTTINGVPVGYTVAAGDTPATIAAGIAAAGQRHDPAGSVLRLAAERARGRLQRRRAWSRSSRRTPARRSP